MPSRSAPSTGTGTTPAANSPAPQPRPGDGIDVRDALSKGLIEQQEVRFGLIAPFTGPNREFGHQLTLGVQTAFNAANDSGEAGRFRLKLITADDGYEPGRTPDLVKRMAEMDGVVGFVGNFGTPTAAAVLPWVLDHKLLFFGALTGANVVRTVPPDRYVFNYRASYAEETEAAVRYLVTVRGIKPREIVVFAQDDAFGEAGYAGVVKALRAIEGRVDYPPLKLTYKRNSIDVAEAVAALKARKLRTRAVVMAALYRPATEFIKAARLTQPNLVFTNVSAVGATALAEELALAGGKVGEGVVVTQVVPAVGGHSKAVLDFKAQLAKYFPGEQPDYVSLEAYLDARILIDATRRASGTSGPKPSADRIADALEGLGSFDMGLGTVMRYGPSEHQASHMVWGTQIDANGKYVAIELQ